MPAWHMYVWLPRKYYACRHAARCHQIFSTAATAAPIMSHANTPPRDELCGAHARHMATAAWHQVYAWRMMFRPPGLDKIYGRPRSSIDGIMKTRTKEEWDADTTDSVGNIIGSCIEAALRSAFRPEAKRFAVVMALQALLAREQSRFDEVASHYSQIDMYSEDVQLQRRQLLERPGQHHAIMARRLAQDEVSVVHSICISHLTSSLHVHHRSMRLKLPSSVKN